MNQKKLQIQKLPDSELEVMQVIWKYDSKITRQDISNILDNTHVIAPTTLLTLLSRLEKKGFIKIEKKGRNSLYTPIISEKDYLAAQSNRFFNKLCGSSLPTFAKALCDSGLTKKEIEELRELLEKNSL